MSLAHTQKKNTKSEERLKRSMVGNDVERKKFTHEKKRIISKMTYRVCVDGDGSHVVCSDCSVGKESVLCGELMIRKTS